MNPTESQPELSQPQAGPDPAATLESLRQQYERLQSLFQLTLVALILLSLGVNLFLFKQMRLARNQLAQEQIAVGKVAQDFNRSGELIRTFAARMQLYAVTHPDFRLVFDKYRSALGPYLTAPVPVAPAPPSRAPAPIPPAAAPKAGQK